MQVSAAASFPGFPFLFDQPNHYIFLCHFLFTALQLLVISLLTVLKYYTHFCYFFFWPLLMEAVDGWAPYFFSISISNFFSAISMACCHRSARNSATRKSSLSSLFSSSNFLYAM